MKKISMILMAFALAMMMSQCKKNEGQPTSNDEVVTITLDVKQNNGSKLVVNPNTGTVNFESGDKIYVGSGGKYVGFLTHNGTNFSGNITNPTENQPLQFYFLGNVTPQETLSAGTTEECSVIISDQTEHLPVISCAASNENYVSGVTAYSAHLLNKCALVKFNVTTPSNSPICITGMKNKVTVDFTQNTMIPSQDGDGVIMLPAGSGENVEKWAILLPQEALEEGEEGSAYSADGFSTGVRPAIPAINENDYLSDDISVTMGTGNSNGGHIFVDLGLPSGTLWAICNVGADTPEGYGDYFAWGETQPKSSYSWSNYQYCQGSENTLTKYCFNPIYGYNGFTDSFTALFPEDDAATANWGKDWRMPTREEWQELYNNTSYSWITLNGVKGRILIASNGNSLFLPATGYLNDNSRLYSVGSSGYYWSSSLNTYVYPNRAWYSYFYSDSQCGTGNWPRNCGQSVRAVRSSRQN